MLVSPTSLAPLLDMDLQVEFHCERAGTTFRVPACLSSSQLTGRTALVTVVPAQLSAADRRVDSDLAGGRARPGRAAHPRHLATALSAVACGCRTPASWCRRRAGRSGCACSRPVLEAGTRIGPCFLVASSEKGMAGLCQVQVTAQVPGARRIRRCCWSSRCGSPTGRRWWRRGRWMRAICST